MMEENNGDALVYFAKPMHKKYSTTFVWGHPSRGLFNNYVKHRGWVGLSVFRDVV